MDHVRMALMLGERTKNRQWIVNKTLISRELSGGDQNEIESGLLIDLQKDIEAELNWVEFDREAYNYKADVMKGITE